MNWQRRLASLAVIGLLLAVVFTVGQAETDVLVYRLAGLADLAADPTAIVGSAAEGDGLVAVVLPGGDVAVVLRPIPWEEYGSYQVQAVSVDMIERQMLAAAMVVPAATEADIAGFSPELIALLQRQVNAISGYDVFSLPP